MPTNPDPVTLFQVVQRAVDITDPTDTDGDLGDLLLAFEDADEPARGAIAVEERLATAVSRIDPEGDSPTIAVAAAIILYLVHRRDEVGAEPAHILQLSARAEWKGDPPAAVADYLAGRGVEA